MRAAVFHGREDIRIEELPEPEPRDDEVLVDVEWCGICGSDLHEYTSGPLVFPQSPHPLTGDTLPCIMGYEFAGLIRSAPQESGFEPGQKVVADPRFLCGACHSCQKGIDHCCTKIGFLGYSGRGGGFANVVPVSAKMLHVVPHNIALDEAASVEPLVTAYHAVGAAKVTNWASKSVLIIGGGPVGLFLLLALRAEKVSQILVSEPTEARRKVLLDFADVVIDPRADDVAGVPQSITAAFQATRIGGTYVNVAVWEKPMVVPFWDFLFKDITIRPALAYTKEEFTKVIQMLSEGKFDGYTKLISTRIGLSDLVEKGFKELIDNKDKHSKIPVTPK